MNKPLIIALIVILGGLAAYKTMGPTPDTTPDLPEIEGVRTDDIFTIDIGGVETDETPEWDIQTEARMEGPKSVLEFTITETHGWGARGIQLSFWHLIKNEETGEWERDPNFNTNGFICNKPLLIGKPLVYRVVLAEVETDMLPDGDIGTSEEWDVKVDRVASVFKPAP